MPGTALAPEAAAPAEDDVFEPDYSASSPLADSSAILATFQQAAPECILPAGYLSHVCTQAVARDTNAGDMRATFTFVTRPKKNEPNRAGRMIQIVPGQFGQGIIQDAYVKNPIVLFNHGMDGFSFPVGLSEDKNGKFTCKYTKSQGSADVYFNQSCPYSEDVFRMVQAGMLRAASIGFNPLKVVPMRWGDANQNVPGVELVQQFGFDVTESEQIEWSIVAAGADAGALRQCLETGKIGNHTYRPMLRQFFQAHAEPRQAWAPGIGAGTIHQVGQGAGLLSDPAVNDLRQMFKEFADTITGAIRQIAPAMPAQPLPLAENPQPAAAVATQANLVTPAPHSTISHVSNVTAPAAQPAATQQEFTATLQSQLSAVVSRAVTSAVQPVVEAQNGILNRINNLSGKLPD